MKKASVHVIPYGGFDIPGLEDWLAAMAAKGLRFQLTVGPIAWFDRVTAQQVQVHLEPIRGDAKDDPDLNAIYEEAGWQYWGMFRGSYYVYASSDLEAQAHTDPDALDYGLKKFFRQKLLGGVLLLWANVLLLGLYRQGAPWEIDLLWLQNFPVETLSNGMTIPFLLAAVGFVLVDLSYLLGLFHLMRYRRALRNGVRARGHRGMGWLLTAGVLILLPVLINTAQLFCGINYRPYELEGSGFVTLTDIEGENFLISHNELFSMDYISHGGTLLDPESWYFRQYGAFGRSQDSNDVPHLELSITRYPLEALAKLRAEEYSRQGINGSGDYTAPACDYGLDEIYYAPRAERTHINEASGETHVFLPGGIFILRLGSTVLCADYYGYQDLTKHLEQFSTMLKNL